MKKIFKILNIVICVLLVMILVWVLFLYDRDREIFSYTGLEDGGTVVFAQRLKEGKYEDGGNIADARVYYSGAIVPMNCDPVHECNVGFALSMSTSSDGFLDSFRLADTSWQRRLFKYFSTEEISNFGSVSDLCVMKDWLGLVTDIACNSNNNVN